MADDGFDREQARGALERQLSDIEGEPTCALCRAEADFFLFEPDRVAKFVCWEHVSPLSAAVDVAASEAHKPLALPLSDEFS